MHPLSQFCQDNLSGPFKPLYIAFVKNQFNEYKASGKQLWLYTVICCKNVQSQGERGAKGGGVFVTLSYK